MSFQSKKERRSKRMSEEHFFYTNYTTQSAQKPSPPPSDHWEVLSREPIEPRLQFTLGVLGGTLAWLCKVPWSCFTCSLLLEHTLWDKLAYLAGQREAHVSVITLFPYTVAGTTPVDWEMWNWSAAVIGFLLARIVWIQNVDSWKMKRKGSLWHNHGVNWNKG